MSATELHWRLARRLLHDRPSVILCYHGVGRSPLSEDPGFLRVDPAQVRRHIELLHGAGYEFVTAADFARRTSGLRPPPGLVALTFDDGLADNHEALLPMLREYRVTATVYVVTGWLGKANPFMPASSGLRMMTEDQLRELAAAGVELGAHTVTHPDLSLLTREECFREMRESRAALEQATGAQVRTFAYPYCRYGPAALAAAREAGFDAAVTCDRRGSWASHEMKRALISGKDGLPSFLLKLRGGYEPLFYSAPGTFARVATRAARRRGRALLEPRG